MRVKARIPVRIDGIDQLLWTENVSEGGCLIIGVPSDINLKPGQQIFLAFEFSSEKKIRLSGIVKHVNDHTIGVEFDKPFKGLVISALSLKNTIGTLTSFAEEIAEIQKSRVRKLAKKVSSFFSGLKTAILLFFLFSMVFSVLQHKMVQFEREKVIHQIEKERHTKVITLIHRQETVNFLGIPIRQYIKIEDAEAILRIIRSVPSDKPIDLILHTPGGVLLPAYQIARAIKKHKGTVTVFIPHYAMSGGTLIALAADKIVMDKNAVLGPVDPQLIMENKVSVPAASVLKIPEVKSWDSISDTTVVLFDQAEKAIEQVKDMVRNLLKGRDKKMIDKVIERLVIGLTTHDYPLFYEDARKLGLPVSINMPSKIYQLMDLFGSQSRAVFQ